MNMTATSLTTQDTIREKPPLMPVDQLQSVQKNSEATGVNEDKESLNQTTDQQMTTGQQMTTEEVEEAVESFQEMSETIQTQLEFSVHEESDKIVVKIFDKESGELIRQVPSEEMLALQDKMRDLTGLLFDEKA